MPSTFGPNNVLTLSFALAQNDDEESTGFLKFSADNDMHLPDIHEKSANVLKWELVGAEKPHGCKELKKDESLALSLALSLWCL